MPEYVNVFLLLVLMVGIALVIPPEWDPAMRLKEYNERVRREREES